ncbi:hypothetical protein ES703_102525 [subsurface metagenome]
MNGFTQEEREWFHSEPNKQILGKASEIDRKYFKAHPTETDYVRPALFLEFPDADINPYVHVIKLSDTVRQRLPVPVNDKQFLRTWGFYTYGVYEIFDIVARLMGVERKELLKIAKKPE